MEENKICKVIYIDNKPFPFNISFKKKFPKRKLYRLAMLYSKELKDSKVSPYKMLDFYIDNRFINMNNVEKNLFIDYLLSFY